MRHAIIIMAALLGSTVMAWDGQRIVKVPEDLRNTPNASLDSIGGIAVNTNTYAAICALGDAAMVRRLIPSTRGADALTGLQYGFMAAPGWEVPEAARHKRLYDIAYSAMTNTACRTNLVGGVKIYQLCFPHAGMDEFVLGWHDTTPADSFTGKVLVGALGHSAMQGTLGFMGEDEGYGLYLDLWSSFVPYGLAYQNDDLAGGHQSDVQYAIEQFKNASGEQNFRAKNYLARGGIKSGDPLRAIDPFGARWWLDRLAYTPMIVPGSALGQISNRVWTVTNALRVVSGSLSAVAHELVMAGGGSRDLATQVVRSESAKADAPGMAEMSVRQIYTQDTASLGVYALVESKSSQRGGYWTTIDSKQVVGGTLFVDRMDTEYLTERRIIGGGASSRIVEDVKTTEFKSAKLWCQDHTEWPRGIGYPHQSSVPYVVQTQVGVYGSCTHEESTPLVDMVVEDKCHLSSASFSIAPGAGLFRPMCDVYFSVDLDLGEDSSFDGMRLNVDVPDINDSTSKSTIFRTRFVPDDPIPGDPGVYTNFYDGGGLPTEYDMEDPSKWPPWDDNGFDDVPVVQNPVGEDGTTRYRVPCPAYLSHGGGGMDYQYYDIYEFLAPSFYLLIGWDFPI